MIQPPEWEDTVPKAIMDRVVPTQFRHRAIRVLHQVLEAVWAVMVHPQLPEGHTSQT